MLCTNIVLNVKTKTKNNFCTQHVLDFYFSCNSMNNFLLYCGLTDSRMRASDTDLPVLGELLDNTASVGFKNNYPGDF